MEKVPDSSLFRRQGGSTLGRRLSKPSSFQSTTTGAHCPAKNVVLGVLGILTGLLVAPGAIRALLLAAPTSLATDVTFPIDEYTGL
jgi:hypothetical protein